MTNCNTPPEGTSFTKAGTEPEGIHVPSRLSYSSLSGYAECGERWRLERGHKLSSSTWFATVAGSAVHEITELWDKKELGLFDGEIPEFEPVFQKYIDEAEKKGQTIKASGRVAKTHSKSGGPNKKDREWWLVEGPEIIQRYIDWRKLTRWQIPILPDGQPGIEVVLTVDLGGEANLGFIDRVFVLPDGRLIVVDIKTGKEPSGKLQLGSYRIAFQKQFGIDVDVASFWMGDTGDITSLVDLSHLTEEYVDALYSMAYRGIRAGVFLPNVTSMCKGCNVAEWCRAVNGRSAVTIPIEDVILPPRAPREVSAEVSEVTAAPVV